MKPASGTANAKEGRIKVRNPSLPAGGNRRRPKAKIANNRIANQNGGSAAATVSTPEPRLLRQSRRPAVTNVHASTSNQATAKADRVN